MIHQAGDNRLSFTKRHCATWLQTCDGCLTCRPDDVCGHHSLTSSMSGLSSSRSVQLLETELSLSLEQSATDVPDILVCHTLPRFLRELRTFRLFRQSYILF